MNDRERLSKWMDEQNKTVTDIAAELGVKRTYLSAVKGGSRTYGWSFIFRFRKVYGNEITDAIFVDELNKPIPEATNA